MKTIGVITNNDQGVFQRAIIDGVREIAQEHRYNVEVDVLAEDRHRKIRAISLNVDSLAGILVVADVLPQDTLIKLHQIGKPVSLVSHYVPELPIPAVISNNIEGITRLARYLIEGCGRGKFVYIRGEPTQRDSIEREEAFRNELIRHDLEAAHMLRGDFDPNIASNSVKALLATDTEFDAMVAADYLMAVEALKVLQDTHYRVPQDISVVGFGDGIEAADAGLTTVAANVTEQGRRAARQLLGQIKGLQIRGLTVLSTELIIRRTCRVSQ
jgi:LacI family transcriptional regulator